MDWAVWVYIRSQGGQVGDGRACFGARGGVGGGGRDLVGARRVRFRQSISLWDLASQGPARTLERGSIPFAPRRVESVGGTKYHSTPCWRNQMN